MNKPGPGKFRRAAQILSICGVALLAAACTPSAPALLPTTTPAGATSTPTSLPPTATAAPTETPAVPELAAPGAVLADDVVRLDAESVSGAAAFDSEAYQVVRVDLSAVEGAPGYTFQLIDKFGNTLVNFDVPGGQVAAAVDEITLPFRGRYRAALTLTEGVGVVQVVATALDVPGGGGDLGAVGNASQGVMGGGRASHVYGFALSAGDVVTLAAVPLEAGALDVRMALYGPDGLFITGAGGAEAGLRRDAVLPGFVVETQGQYVAVVSNDYGTAGAYEFSVLSDTVLLPAESPADLTVGQVYRAGFYAGEEFSASFDGAAGDVLRIEVVDIPASLALDVRLTSPYGEVLAYAVGAPAGNAASISEVQLPYTGRYRLDFTWMGEGQAAFQITTLGQEALTGGGLLEGHRAAADARLTDASVFHSYQFEARAGDRITLALESGSTRGQIDLIMALLGPDGRQMALVNDAADGLSPDPALTRFPVSLTGTYTVIVTSITDARGVYHLDYRREE